MTFRVINSAWKKLFPKSVHERDSGGFEPSSDDPTHVMYSIFDFGKSMGFEVNVSILKSYGMKLVKNKPMKMLQDLHIEVQRTTDEVVTLDEM